MPKPNVRRDGDTWRLEWSDLGVEMCVERLRESREDLHGEVTINSVADGAGGRLYGPTKLNLLSTPSQTQLANALQRRVNGLGDAWLGLVVQGCAIVAQQYREPAPTQRLTDLLEEGPVEYLFDRLVPAFETTMLYGDGESGKSILAQRCAVSAATGEPLPWGERPEAQVNVMVCDWETNGGTVKRRFARICRGMGIRMPDNIFYRSVSRTLEDELPHLRVEVSRLDIGLLIVDSIGFACSGPLVEDQTARSALSALRQLDPATRLVIAHVSNDTARQSTGRARPFGSAFFWNGMRSGVEVRRAEDSSETVVELGLYHRKANDGEHHPDIGLRLRFEDGPGGPIVFEPETLADVPDLYARTSLPHRIRVALRRGALDTNALAEVVDAKPETVARTARRMPDIVQLNPQGGHGRGRVAEWGLARDG